MDGVSSGSPLNIILSPEPASTEEKSRKLQSKVLILAPIPRHPLRGYIWSQLFLSSVMDWNIALALLPSPSTFQLGKQSQVWNFSPGPPLWRKQQKRNRAKWVFKAEKKGGSVYLTSFQRSVCHMCKRPSKHNRREKLGKATARLLGCHQAGTDTWTLPGFTSQPVLWHQNLLGFWVKARNVMEPFAEDSWDQSLLWLRAYPSLLSHFGYFHGVVRIGNVANRRKIWEVKTRCN